MFPFQQSHGETTIDFSCNSHQQSEIPIPQDLMFMSTTHASKDGTDLFSSPSNIMGKGGPKTKLLATNNLDKENYAKPTTTDDGNNKATRRDMERQRRKEMASLYASLRSQIPYEYTKGNRSIAEHTTVTVDYIKHLQTRIEELGARRDDLKKMSNLNPNNNGGIMSYSSSSCSSSWVSVQTCSAGVDIAVSSSNSMGQDLPLSRVLKLLLEEGLTNLVSCVTIKVDEKLVHTIQAEVSDPTRINISQLQHNLTEAISSRIH